MAAATRLADKHSLTLDEAASSATNPQSAPISARRQRAASNYDAASPETAATASVHDIGELRGARWPQSNHEVDKKRWQDAVNQAKSRGLDNSGAKKSSNDGLRARRSNGSRRNPLKYAEILLKETSFSIKEIADITRLNIYMVVEIKLKMRKAA